MAQTSEGGKQAARTNKEQHGSDFYKRIGSAGGKAKSPLKGFGSNRALAVEAGRRGGEISKRKAKD